MSEAKHEGIDLKSHMIKTKGNKDYLPVAARTLWFREEYSIAAGWGIRTRKVDGGLKEGFAEFYAEVVDPEGRVVGTGSNVEDKAGFVDFLMKAETGAIGRALAACGYGTMAALEEGEIVDAPVERKAQQKNGHAPAPEPDYFCAKCEAKIVPAGNMPVASVANLSVQKFGRILCVPCGKAEAKTEKVNLPAEAVAA